jgi:hypothetical protein
MLPDSKFTFDILAREPLLADLAVLHRKDMLARRYERCLCSLIALLVDGHAGVDRASEERLLQQRQATGRLEQ